MALQLSCRADLFRAAIRFAPRDAGIRLEPVHGKPGGVLAAWSDDAALVIYDVTAVVVAPMRMQAPRDFVDAVAREVRKRDPNKARVRAAAGNLTCDGIDLVAANAVGAVGPSPWRRELEKHGVCRLSQGPLTLRRDVMDDIGEAARMLARAAGVAMHQCERAEYLIRGGMDGALVAAFPDFPDAFALIGRTRAPEDCAWAWHAPWWLAEPANVGVVA